MTKNEALTIARKAAEESTSGFKRSRLALVGWFIEQLGLVEEPVNKVDCNDWFYGRVVSGKAFPWCATFICYGHSLCGLPYPAMGWKHGFCSVPDYHKRAIAGQRITNDPQPMDDVIFDWNQDGADDHIGKFVAWGDESKTWFWTIEGNTASDDAGNQSRGGCVAFKKRYKKHVSAFISVEHILKP